MNAKNRFSPYNGPPSKLHPNQYKGVEQSGGYLAPNSAPASANSPAFKGRLWVSGFGWFWLAAWRVQGRKGEYLSLRTTPMSDVDAERYCKQQPSRPAQDDSYVPPSRPQTGYDDGDIPF